MTSLNQAMNLPNLYNPQYIDIAEFNSRTNQHSLTLNQYSLRKNLTICLTPSEGPKNVCDEDNSLPQDSTANYYPNTLENNKIIQPELFNQNCNPCGEKNKKKNSQKQTYTKYVDHKQLPNEDIFVVNLVEPLIIDSISSVEIENISIYTDSGTSLGKDLILIGVKEFNIKNNTNDPNLKGQIVISNILKDRYQPLIKKSYYSMITDNGPARYGYVSSIPPGKYSQLNISISSYDLNLCSQNRLCDGITQLNPSPIFKEDNCKKANASDNNCKKANASDNNEHNEHNERRPRIILSYVINQDRPYIPKNIMTQVPIAHNNIPQPNITQSNIPFNNFNNNFNNSR